MASSSAAAGRRRTAAALATTHGDAHADEHVAHAEDVVQRQPGGQREDVRERPGAGSGTIELFEYSVPRSPPDATIAAAAAGM